MDKLAKIEELINKYLSKAWEFIVHLILKLTPKKIFDVRDKIIHAFHQFIEKIKHSPQYLKAGIHHAVAFLGVILGAIKGFLHVIKNLPWKKPHLMGKEIIVISYKKFSDYGEKYELTKWQVVSLFFITVSTFVATPIYVVKNAKVIYHFFHPAPINRMPASVEVDHAPKRPTYYRIEEHQYDLKNIYIPVYKYNRDGTSFVKMKALNADFKVTLSNRYAREFLLQNNVEFLDRLNASFEPMLKQFPIQDEGRNVLKGKIGYEIDSFLKEKGVEGKASVVSVERLMSF